MLDVTCHNRYTVCKLIKYKRNGDDYEQSNNLQQ